MTDVNIATAGKGYSCNEYATNNLYYQDSKWKIKKFADKTSKAFEAITGIKYYSLSREEKERIRPLYVKFAEGCKEIFGEDVWVNALTNEYKPELNITNKLFNLPNIVEREYPNWIITDMRFPNELKAVKDRGGITIRVVRPVHALSQKNHCGILHPSETALDNAEFDEIVDNSGTIEELIEQIKQILTKRKII